jgi:serine/threonine-protein kinase
MLVHGLFVAIAIALVGCSALEPDSEGSVAEAQSCDHVSTQLFPVGSTWTTAIDAAAIDPQSAVIVDHLATWHDSSGRFRIDFGFHVLEADATSERRAFTTTGEFYDPDCDPAPMPVPALGAVEGESGYECMGGGDCHLLVVDRSRCRLYEMWRADITSAGFFGGCQAVWSLSAVYPAAGRGEYCTSADAAGLPITPLLFDADEIARGEIPHALRFTLPNQLIRKLVYLHPATHSTSATTGSHYAPPFGARFRLRADYDPSSLSPAGQVVVAALKRYGMFLADGGKNTFIAKSDRFTATKWSDVGLEEHHLMGLSWSDFEVVEGGERIDAYTGRCTRTPIVE